MPVASVSTMAHRMRRTILAGAATALALALTTGCTPEPEPAPSPSPTGFASEEEAFAAAEATYRAYVDALNQVDLSDPATFEAPLAWTTGNLNSADKKSFSQSHAEKESLVGAFKVRLVEPARWDRQTGVASLFACLDVSGTDVLDSDGVSKVPVDRSPVIALDVELVKSATTETGFAVTETTAREGDPQC